MLTKRKTTAGKWLVYVGLWIFAAGFAFSEFNGMEGKPDFLELASVPLIIIGLLMIILSNFFNKKASDFTS
ncbi:hypothetical protein CEH05_16645 [Halobacillus halophilus]|uniref:Uncharacterized protein n=1 Tax=Halobacillus halophilus (strain ATCC 35676 / DSM 2266 / JCM 20832 / KCTC 3685 / LMG 17431 / NBRC 102448 / NCIMB 2269) TaxID=866895 RepID=I0JRE3_HALH3|nr:hypothetical protein [Halobacillus halophilus]ASF40692.1 hypothetical protein CEH05_16645 [Halobacillus halophilus]CCG46713.1 hypothetical protein HBHAL_4372 [Halobacillus halophilus DSM 2266]